MRFPRLVLVYIGSVDRSIDISFDPFMATNGLLGGLVAITASSPMVETEGSFVIGFVSGVLVFYGSRLLLKFKV